MFQYFFHENKYFHIKVSEIHLRFPIAQIPTISFIISSCVVVKCYPSHITVGYQSYCPVASSLIHRGLENIYFISLFLTFKHKNKLLTSLNEKLFQSSCHTSLSPFSTFALKTKATDLISQC